MKQSIVILCGGRSPEHEVSVRSSISVVKHINKTKYDVNVIAITKDTGEWRYYGKNNFSEGDPKKPSLSNKDYKQIVFMPSSASNSIYYLDDKNELIPIKIDVVLPIMHGTNCEDGTIQGLLESLNIPFAGCKTLDSAISMDKNVTKALAELNDIPVVPGIEFSVNEDIDDELFILVDEDLGYPVFVKPTASGSSFGVTKVKKQEDLKAAILEGLKYSKSVLIEKAINAREIECAVLGNWFSDIFASKVLGEIRPKKEFYSYEAKYIDDDGAELIIPAELKLDTLENIQLYAISVFSALKCHGMARIDFFLDKDNGKIYFNELNTLPGFTSISMYPKLWEESGLGYAELIDQLIEFAIQAHKK